MISFNNIIGMNIMDGCLIIKKLKNFVSKPYTAILPNTCYAYVWRLFSTKVDLGHEKKK